ncbi:GNAT family N-acetyltransferase [Anaerolinea thermophila]|uniref:Acetyltransferase n=1 Tax=Anaerolinea thermophila (strain DSM 14523 / JCM 11388 / NBRC 100420 / UNI-1) TaxID=926569 RepID=E8N4D4_ANATU|nr:GNAT family protein [Anaerolinea thermophila]BAJ63298.1 putative acetyltransferase [Anaerolinea thermophila UNI-1]
MLFSQRLRLRPIQRSDLPFFVEWLNDPEVRQFITVTVPLSLEEEEQWYEQMLKQPKPERPFAIEVREEGEWRLIGNITLFDLSWVNRSAEVGILIGDKRFWNRGYGREAMRLMVQHAFETLNLNRVYLRVDVENIRGIKSYEQAGFVKEGILRQANYRNGKYSDMMVMSVLRSEWQTPTREGV